MYADVFIIIILAYTMMRIKCQPPYSMRILNMYMFIVHMRACMLCIGKVYVYGVHTKVETTQEDSKRTRVIPCGTRGI